MKEGEGLEHEWKQKSEWKQRHGRVVDRETDARNEKQENTRAQHKNVNKRTNSPPEATSVVGYNTALKPLAWGSRRRVVLKSRSEFEAENTLST